ncbi:MAG TPA: GNAT family N-acetyltransferase [Runella sp.]|nr:GNAT family N-acetyltransferase [Runella sp.]
MTHLLPKNKVQTTIQRAFSSLVFDNDPTALTRFRGRWSPWLFNTPLHVVHQQAEQVYTFVLTDAETQQELYGFFHLFVQNQQGVSPLRASFGSFEVAEVVSHADFSFWLNSVESFAVSQGIKSLSIRHYPSCYHPARSSFIKRGLVRHGFQLSQSSINHYISVTSQPFETALHASERRRLRKCLQAGFRFEEWVSPSAEQVYQFIAHNRQRLGYSLSFREEQLRLWLTIFPEIFRVFCIKNGEEIASLGLTVRVGKNVLYHFCPADNLAYRQYSPSVLLTKGLYEFSQQEGVTILDLGISVDAAGQPKTSLARFKRNLGAQECEKWQFEREIGISTKV